MIKGQKKVVTNVTEFGSPSPDESEILEKNSDFSDFIYDATGRAANILQGEMLRGVDRLFIIKNVGWKNNSKNSYDIIEPIFPTGWAVMIRNAANQKRTFEDMLKLYAKKEFNLAADVLHQQIILGGLFYWWPGL